MLRLKHLRTKLLISLLALCLLLTYIIKSRASTHTAVSKYDMELEEFKYETRKVFHSNKSKPAVVSPLLSEHDIAKQIELDLKYLAEQRVSSMKAVMRFSRNESFKVTKENERHLDTKSGNKYLILEYTKVFFQPKFCSKTSAQIFNSQLEACEYSNCLYSCDKQADLARADALLFHQRDLETEMKRSASFDEWLASTRQLPFKTVAEKLQRSGSNQV